MFKNVMSIQRFKKKIFVLSELNVISLFFSRRKKNRMPRKFRRPSEDDFAKYIQLCASETIFMTTNKLFINFTFCPVHI